MDLAEKKSSEKFSAWQQLLEKHTHWLTFFAGAGVTLSLAPFHFWILLFPCLTVLVWQLDTAATSKQSFLRAWNFGFGLNLASVSWVFVSINFHSNTPFLIALLLTVIFCGFLGFLYGLAGWLFSKLFVPAKNEQLLEHLNFPGASSSACLLLAFPTVMVFQEYIKTWLFTGFPWPFLGYGQMDSPLAGFAPVIGVNGISFLCCMLAVFLYWLIKPVISSTQKIISASGILIIFVCGFALQYVEWTKATGIKTSVSLIQANIPQEKKWLPDFFPETLMRYRTLSHLEWSKQGLVIWPESAFPKLYVQVADIIDEFDKQAKANQAGFVTGVLSHQTNSDGLTDYYNSIFAFGEAGGTYNKRHLVPFGEVVPFQSLLKPLGSIFALPMSSFARGEAAQQPLIFKGIRFSPYICYEIIYPQYIIRDIKNTDVLLTISNDTWFGKSHGPWQHVQMAQMRAAESGRYLVRSNNNGFSMVSNHKGEILKLSNSFTQDVISEDVEVMTGLTPFMQWGQWPVFLTCALSLVLCSLLKRTTQRQ